jgi:hypothetical protein
MNWEQMHHSMFSFSEFFPFCYWWLCKTGVSAPKGSPRSIPMAFYQECLPSFSVNKYLWGPYCVLGTLLGPRNSEQWRTYFASGVDILLRKVEY